MSRTLSLTVVPPALRGWVLPALILLFWWWAVASGWSTSPLLVSPVAVWDRALQQVTSGELWAALSASLWRNARGFLLGASAGLAVGVLLGWSRWAERLVGPSFHTLKQISLFAWIPMLSMWFGLGDGAKVAFIVQHASTLLRKRPLASTQAGREILAGESMLRIAAAFDRGDPAPAEDEIASGAEALAEDVGEVLAALRNAGLVVPTAEGGLVPSRSLDRITLLDVRTAMVGPGAEPPADARVGKILKDVEDQAGRRLSEVTFADLVSRAGHVDRVP